MLLALCVLCLVSLSPLVHGGGRNPIEPFEASFSVERDGVAIGEALLRVDYPDKEHYRMHSSLRLTGMIRLISSDSVDEDVDGELVGGVPVPLTYRSQRSGKKARSVDQRFAWARGEVAVNKNGEETVLKLQPRTVDPLSLHYLVMSDLRAGSNTAEYSVVSSNRLKTYRTRLLGKATIKTALGELETLMVSRQRRGSDKQTTAWHAPELGYLPVRISKTDDGAEVARLTIKALER